LSAASVAVVVTTYMFVEFARKAIKN